MVKVSANAGRLAADWCAPRNVGRSNTPGRKFTCHVESGIEDGRVAESLHSLYVTVVLIRLQDDPLPSPG